MLAVVAQILLKCPKSIRNLIMSSKSNRYSLITRKLFGDSQRMDDTVKGGLTLFSELLP